MASDAIAGDLRDRLSQRQPSIRLLTDQRADRIDDFISTAIGDSNSQNHPGIGCCGLGGGTDRVAQRAGQEVEFSDRPHPNATVVDVRAIGERGDLRFYRSKDTRDLLERPIAIICREYPQCHGGNSKLPTPVEHIMEPARTEGIDFTGIGHAASLGVSPVPVKNDAVLLWNRRAADLAVQTTLLVSL